MRFIFSCVIVFALGSSDGQAGSASLAPVSDACRRVTVSVGDWFWYRWFQIVDPTKFLQGTEILESAEWPVAKFDPAKPAVAESLLRYLMSPLIARNPGAADRRTVSTNYDLSRVLKLLWLSDQTQKTDRLLTVLKAWLQSKQAVSDRFINETILFLFSQDSESYALSPQLYPVLLLLESRGILFEWDLRYLDASIRMLYTLSKWVQALKENSIIRPELRESAGKIRQLFGQRITRLLQSAESAARGIPNRTLDRESHGRFIENFVLAGFAEYTFLFEEWEAGGFKKRDFPRHYFDPMSSIPNSLAALAEAHTKLSEFAPRLRGLSDAAGFLWVATNPETARAAGGFYGSQLVETIPPANQLRQTVEALYQDVAIALDPR